MVKTVFQKLSSPIQKGKMWLNKTMNNVFIGRYGCLKTTKNGFLKQFPFSEDTLRYPSTLLNRTDICHHISGGTTCSKSGRHGGKGVVGKFG